MKNLTLISLIFFGFLLFSCGKNNNKSNDVSTASNDKIEQVEFKCDGMTCSGCETTIKNEVNKINGIKEVQADHVAKTVKVSYAGNVTSKSEIQKAINDAGYDTQESKAENKHECDKDKMKGCDEEKK
jgi:copper chaperone CopZ